MVSNIFYFHPYLGKISNLTNIFQLGWNHQLCSNISHPKAASTSEFAMEFPQKLSIFRWTTSNVSHPNFRDCFSTPKLNSQPRKPSRFGGKRSSGSEILRFASLCGGLPSPEAAGSNPLGTSNKNEKKQRKPSVLVVCWGFFKWGCLVLPAFCMGMICHKPWNKDSY